jgi:hypothetical protein
VGVTEISEGQSCLFGRMSGAESVLNMSPRVAGHVSNTRSLQPPNCSHGSRVTLHVPSRSHLCGPKGRFGQVPSVSALLLARSSFTGAQSRVELMCDQIEQAETKQGPPEPKYDQRSARCAKAKAKKKASVAKPKPKAWPFEDLMMFWDVAFERWCEDTERKKVCHSSLI